MNKRLQLTPIGLGVIFTSSLLLSACGGDSNNSSKGTNNELPIDITAPIISNVLPNSNAVTHSRKVIITGQASDETELKSVVIINGEDTVIATMTEEAEGAFEATLEANAGENNYSVVATDTSNNEATSEASFYFGSQASAGGAHSGVIRNEALYAWGRNNKGQAGIGAITKLSENEDNPGTHPTAPVLISDEKFVSLAFNQNASSALDINGEVWSWGDGGYGQLGLGIANDDIVDDTDYTSPQKIENLNDIVAIDRGYYHMLLLKSDGTVLAMGRNSDGQLGDGSDVNQDTPVAVQGLTDIVQISAASSTSYAIDKDGRLWAWGSNDNGQLANGISDSEIHNTPAEITIAEEVITNVTSGKDHALALTESGKVYAWGLNASSQVSEASEDRYVLTPVLLPWFEDVIAVWANGNQSFIQRIDGKIYPWGQNLDGTLGIESDDNITRPENAIPGLENVADLGNGALHTLAIVNNEDNTDSSVYSWGWSFEGSLGGGSEQLNIWTYVTPTELTVESADEE